MSETTTNGTVTAVQCEDVTVTFEDGTEATFDAAVDMAPGAFERCSVGARVAWERESAPGSDERRLKRSELVLSLIHI
jgi:hypothetical protein